ncbi:MAG: caspase family protein [Haliscomenobacter sp.]|nr:caspase family protein [Haliscomenobacter sp.]MBK9489853.1 caspase family protein [Haliscomenobacter sp.]
MPQLHALLIAINEYAPGSGVRNLTGCLNDLAGMQALLLKHYAHLQPNIRTLINADATRKGVIQAFREHLTGPQIKKGDQVLFYYSGHGSYGPTAPEFAYNNPLKQDETMVCYDSRLPGKQDLSDKERGALLAEIPKGVEVLFIIDSCHAASSLRNHKAAAEELGASRFQPGQTTPRTLESYLLADGENIYLKQKQTGQKIAVPERPFVLLAACAETELAMETKDQRGVFSKYLLEVLENAGTDYTYEELMQRVFFLVNKISQKQHPSLETFQAQRRQVFLSKVIRPNFIKNTATYENGHWRLNCGAIHGLPTDPEKLKGVKVQLFDSHKPQADSDHEVGIKSVFSTYSLLDFDQEPRDFFWAAVDFAIALPVTLSGDEKGKKAIQNLLGYKGAKKNWQLAASDAAAKYTVHMEKGQASIVLTSSGQTLYGPTEDTFDINDALNRIARWEQVLALTHLGSKIQNGLKVEFCEEPKDNSALIPYPKQQLSFVLGKTPRGETDTLWYHLRARNTAAQPLHVALLYLSPGYGIEVHYMRRILPPNSDWVKLDEVSRELELGNKTKSLERFLVLYSTSAFEEFQYEQAALDDSSGRDLVRKSLAGDDWATQLFEVELKSE